MVVPKTGRKRFNTAPAAAERADQAEVHIGIHLDHARLINHGVAGKGGLAEKGGNLLAILGDALGAIRHDDAKVDLVEVIAGKGLS